MRTVQDRRGITWICLELPEIPVDQQAAALAGPSGLVAIECNSGAERVIALVPPGWDDAMEDTALSDMILSHLT